MLLMLPQPRIDTRSKKQNGPAERCMKSHRQVKVPIVRQGSAIGIKGEVPHGLNETQNFDIKKRFSRLDRPRILKLTVLTRNPPRQTGLTLHLFATSSLSPHFFFLCRLSRAKSVSLFAKDDYKVSSVCGDHPTQNVAHGCSARSW